MSIPAADVAIQRHRFTVDDFVRMGDAGILTDDDRVELLDGEVRTLTPINPPHAVTVSRLNRRIVTHLGARAYVSVQSPIQLDRHNQPQPDLAIARGSEDDYAERHPSAEDVLLVIEVADSSLHYDRAEKVPRYARAGIPEVWLVDVAAGCIDVHTGAAPDGYRRRRTLECGATLTATTVPTLHVPVDEIVGRG